MQFKAVIPARYASTRLPGKPLLDIAGRPMVIRVADQALKSGAAAVIIASDDDRVLQLAKAFHIQALMTRESHASGTDRIAEVVQSLAWADDEIVVNVQGDEPLIDPQLIHEVAQTLARNQQAVMATACHLIHTKADLLNPNYVKVVFDAEGHALYFSRAPIPYPRDAASDEAIEAYRHIGIYAYRVSFLKQYAQLAATRLEKIECLEQLRVLHHGFKIAVAVTANIPAGGVDTQQDLDHVRALLQASAIKPT